MCAEIEEEDAPEGIGVEEGCCKSVAAMEDPIASPILLFFRGLCSVEGRAINVPW